MVAGEKNQEIEKKIFFDGEVRDYDFYLTAIMASFAKNTDHKLQVLVDNSFLAEKLTKGLKNLKDKIEIIHKAITIDLVEELVKEQPVVVHLDDNFLGDYSHASHFVVLSSIREDGRYEVIDPADGKSKFLTPNQLMSAVLSLKTYLKMSPEIILVK